VVQKIVLAAGIEIRQTQNSSDGILTLLNAKADAGKNSTWTFPKGAAAKATVEVKLVYTSAEFAAALDIADAFVLYDGHSRYGQGPAFGDPRIGHVPDIKAYPTNPWGVHFRMGYDATDTECRGDLLEHSVSPAEYDLPNPPKAAFLPGALVKASARAAEVEDLKAKGKLTKAQKKSPCSIIGAWREMKTCQATLEATKTARGEQPLKDRHYYRQNVQKPHDEFLTAVKVGAADLNKSKLACAVLFMGSCSSREHYYEALESRRKATKSSCKFLLTGDLCSAEHGTNFIKEVFKGLDPNNSKDMVKIVKALNGAVDSGGVKVY
jgi:hypothetical protein